MMVQEFLPQITTEAEWSLIFIGGEYSHGVRKYPVAGDFRVQTQFGGRVEAALPEPHIVHAAANVLRRSSRRHRFMHVSMALSRTASC